MLLEHLRRISGGVASEGDVDLLERYVRRRDGPAFETLVRRHGPMVLGVCRRLLRDPCDAEDAFQATFLVLIRKARSIRRPALLAGWLYGVAYRTALRARRLAARRAPAAKGIEMLAAPEAERVWNDLRPLLDEELSRLPDKYRLPILLCYLQGRTNEEAARQLGWTKGTVSGRLARARELLRGRLVRRGVTLSSAALAGFASELSAAVPPALLQTLCRAAIGPALAYGIVSPTAIALSKGVARAMLLKTLKTTLVGLFLLTVIAVGTALLALNIHAGLREHAPVALAGLVPINEAEGLEAQVLKAQKANRAKFTRGLLHWTLHCKVDGFSGDDEKYETNGVFQLWWDDDRLATRNMEDRRVIDPFGGARIERRGERTAWDGKLFRRMRNDDPQAARGLFDQLKNAEIGLKPEYRHNENWFDIAGWSAVSRFTILHTARDPQQKARMKQIRWSTEDGPTGKEARVTVLGDTGSRCLDAYDLARGGELTRLEWFDDKGRLHFQRLITVEKIGDGWFPVDVESRSIEPDTGKVSLFQHFKLDLRKSAVGRDALILQGTFAMPPMDRLEGAGASP